MKALNFNVSKIVGCIVTHEHGDHAKYYHEFVKSGIDVYSTDGTKESLLKSHGEIDDSIQGVNQISYCKQAKMYRDMIRNALESFL